MKKDIRNEIKSTAHSKYRRQSHIVFAPKYRRKEINGKLRKEIGEILRKLRDQKGAGINEAEACPGHIHMLVSVPPYMSIAQFMWHNSCGTIYAAQFMWHSSCGTIHGISQGEKQLDDI